MKLYFLTGNENKMREAQNILGEQYQLEQITIDLPEIQELDAHKIIRAKLDEAHKHHEGPFIVEDTSLHLDCLGGLPGPLIKWFLESMGDAGIAELAHKYESQKAYARTLIGIAQDKKNIEFVEGIKHGHIVLPRGESSFGWDHIFVPEGETRTYAEMGADKHAISHRRIAVEALKEYLTSYDQQ